MLLILLGYRYGNRHTIIKVLVIILRGKKRVEEAEEMVKKHFKKQGVVIRPAEKPKS